MRIRTLVALLAAVAVLAGCAPADPRARILQERARWQVEPLGWAADDSGTLILSARVSGPVRSELERLTCRIELHDAAGQGIEHEWRTLDLTRVRRGTPTEYLLRLAPRENEIDRIGIDCLSDPTPEEEAYIEELRLPTPS